MCIRDRLMEAYGLRMKAPLTVADFTEAMAAMGEGFAVRALEGIDHPRVTAAVGDEVPEGDWTLFALGVRALVNEFMTPVTDGDSGDDDSGDGGGSSGVE